MELKKVLTSRGVIMAFIVMMLYGCLMFVVYYSGYSAMPKNVDKLPITIVNQDSNDDVENQIKKNLPFKHIHKSSNLKKAQQSLNNHDIFMIINIPDNFTKKIENNKSVNLNFYVNEANPTTATASIKSIANTLGAKLNQEVIVNKSKEILLKSQEATLKQNIVKAQQKMQDNVTLKKQAIAAAPIAEQPELQAQLQKQIDVQQGNLKIQEQKMQNEMKQKVNQVYKDVPNSVNVVVNRVNKVPSGSNNSLAPFINSLVVYFGSLIGALLLYGVYAKFAKTFGRFKSFAYVEIAMLGLAAIGSLIVLFVIINMMGLNMSKLPLLWLNYIIGIFSAYNFNFVMLLLLGQIGTAINILFTMIQIVAGGGMIPVITMGVFFKIAHYISPMFYSIQGSFDIMYGGSGLLKTEIGAITLVAGLLALNLIIVTFRKKQPILDFRKLS